MLQKAANSLWVHGLLSLAIMLPLLLPGYILTLDLVFTPTLDWPTALSNVYVFEALLHVLSWLLPTQVIEKLLLIAVLVVSGVGAHSLTKLIAGSEQLMRFAAYFAGIFYMINPFVYSRFMAGQYLVLLGYAMTPFFVMALIKLITTPSWRNALVLAAWAIAIVGVSLHHVGILLLLAVVVGLAAAWKNRKKLTHLKKAVAFSAVSAGLVLIVNSYWLVPTLLGSTQISQATDSFDSQEFKAFATNGEGTFGALGNVLRLQGFWADARDMYVLPQQVVPAWGLVAILVWVLVVAGCGWLWQRHKQYAMALIGVAVVSIVLAVSPIINWLAGHLPLVAGYREPQKFIALLALVYAVFGAMGTVAVIGWALKGRLSKAANLLVAALLVLPILLTPTVVWGFGGQLSPKDYPSDWYQMNSRLNRDESVGKVLFLPWHQYMNFGFSERIIANPATKFFDKSVVSGDNPEYMGIKPTVPNPGNRNLENEVLSQGGSSTQLGEKLAGLGFSHVILAKEYDYKDYEYLDSQTDIRLVEDTTSLKLYAVIKEGVSSER